MSDVYQRSKFVAVYLNMPKEVPTKMILEDLLRVGILRSRTAKFDSQQPKDSKKVCFVPKVNDEDGSMKMLRVHSIEDLNSFPKVNFAKFSLLEPTLQYDGNPREEGYPRKFVN
jgi:5-formyltetrahydrofolate cyclo-ligase